MCKEIKHIVLLLTLLFCGGALFATKSVSNIVKFMQPDGTVIHFKVVGDEIFGYKQTLGGDIVEVGADGYLYYAQISLSGRRVTGERVGRGSSLLSGAPSNFVISKIRGRNLQYFNPDKLSGGGFLPAGKGAVATKSSTNRCNFIVLPVQFEDVKFSVPNTEESFNAMLNSKGYSANGASGSVADYFNDNFNGAWQFNFHLADIITLDKPLSAYGAPGDTQNDTDIKGLVEEACQKAFDAGVDFSRFDNNGDGIVDNVAIIFAGYSEAEGGDINSIWPHQTSILAENLHYNGVQIGSYSCSAELAGAQGGEMASIGTFCHELIHSFGVPDMYDVNGEDEGESAGLYGSLSIMDRGNFLNGGKTPPYLNSIEREIMGYGDIIDLLPDNNYTLPPVYKSTANYRIKCSREGEYFLLESRGVGKWDSFIGGAGMVVYHIDKSGRVVAGITAAQRWEFNNINSFAPHQCARVILAGAVEEGGNLQSLFFPGQSNVGELLSSGGYMELRDWRGYSVGVGLEEIEYSGGKVHFSTLLDYSYNDSLPRGVESKVVSYQRDARLEWLGEPLERGLGAQWIIKYAMADNPQSEMQLITDTTMCYLENLVAGAEYKVEISYLRGSVYGPPNKLDFRTWEISSKYPYIYVKGDGYRVGERVDFRVFNLLEESTAIKWYVDGQQIDKPWCVFTDSGLKEIKLEIFYKDGSKESIYKNIAIR